MARCPWRWYRGTRPWPGSRRPRGMPSPALESRSLGAGRRVGGSRAAAGDRGDHRDRVLAPDGCMWSVRSAHNNHRDALLEVKSRAAVPDVSGPAGPGSYTEGTEGFGVTEVGRLSGPAERLAPGPGRHVFRATEDTEPGPRVVARSRGCGRVGARAREFRAGLDRLVDPDNHGDSEDTEGSQRFDFINGALCVPCSSVVVAAPKRPAATGWADRVMDHTPSHATTCRRPQGAASASRSSVPGPQRRPDTCRTDSAWAALSAAPATIASTR